jgi:hypothetical protein
MLLLGIAMSEKCEDAYCLPLWVLPLWILHKILPVRVARFGLAAQAQCPSCVLEG